MPTNDQAKDTIVIMAPKGTKARWVRQSQAEGAKLTDWVIKHVEASVQRSHQVQVRITVPPSVNFADLRLTRDSQTGSLHFDWAPLQRICDASGIDIALLRDQPEDNVAGVLAAWYAQHRAAGGLPDAAMDELIGEADIEDTHGHGQSYKPGRA